MAVQEKRFKIRNFVYECLCTLFLVLFFIVNSKTRMVASGVMGVGITVTALLGFYFGWKQRYGWIVLPTALYLSVLVFPLAMVGALLMGTYLYLLMILALIAILVLVYIFDMVQAVLMVFMGFCFLSILAISLVLSGKLNSPCSVRPDVIVAAGGVMSEEKGARHLACGYGKMSLVATFPKTGIVSLLSQGGVEPVERVFSPDGLTTMGQSGGMILVFDKVSGQLSTLDYQTLESYQEIDLFGYSCNPKATVLAKEQMRGMVLCGNSGIVEFIDVVQGEAIKETEKKLGILPYTMVLNEQLDRAYVSDLLGFFVTEVDVETMAPLRRIKVGFGSSDMAVGEKGRTLFVARPFFGRIDLIDTLTLEKKGQLPAPKGVSAIEYDEKRQWLFAASFASGKLIAIDASDFYSIPRWFDLNAGIRDLVYCPESRMLFYSTACSVNYLNPKSLFEMQQ